MNLKKERFKALDLLLVTLKMELGGHKPGNVVASGSWEWTSADSQQGNRDLSPTPQGIEFCQCPTEQKRAPLERDAAPRFIGFS